MHFAVPAKVPAQDAAPAAPGDSSDCVKIQLESFLGQFAAQAAAAAAPPPPPPPPAAFPMRPMRGAAGGLVTTPLSDTQVDPSEKAPGVAPPDSTWRVVSRGSVGHPHSCQEACKYVVKKRGCKDGAMCSRCHLCEWKRNSAAQGQVKAR